MAPPHTRKLQEEKNIEFYALHKHTDWGYNKIAKSTGVARSTARDVVKRSDIRNGDTHDASRPGRPTKISATKKKNNCRGHCGQQAFFASRDIAEKANVGLGKMTVDKIIGEAGFKLILEERGKAKENNFCK
jgi:transposase